MAKKKRIGKEPVRWNWDDDEEEGDSVDCEAGPSNTGRTNETESHDRNDNRERLPSAVESSMAEAPQISQIISEDASSRTGESSLISADEPSQCSIISNTGRRQSQDIGSSQYPVPSVTPGDANIGDWASGDDQPSDHSTSNTSRLRWQRTRDANRSDHGRRSESRGRSINVRSSQRRRLRFAYPGRNYQRSPASTTFARNRATSKFDLDNPFRARPYPRSYYSSYPPTQSVYSTPYQYQPSQHSQYFHGLPQAPPITRPSTPAPNSGPDEHSNAPHGDSSLVPNDLTSRVIIQCTYATLHSIFSTSITHHWPERVAHSELGEIRVYKALNTKRFKKRNGQHALEISHSNAPFQHQIQQSSQMQWLHMQRENMDLAEFEDISLNAPGISGELKYVLLRLFKQIRDTFQKRILNGLHIEPGTVLRCDGNSTRGVGEDNLSVTFLCFPYMTLKLRKHIAGNSSQDYPTRSMLQTLYPYESTASRDSAPAFCKDQSRLSKKIMYIPQLWVVVIGSKYVISCAEADAETVQGSTVTLADSLNSAMELPRELQNLTTQTRRWGRRKSPTAVKRQSDVQRQTSLSNQSPPPVAREEQDTRRRNHGSCQSSTCSAPTEHEELEKGKISEINAQNSSGGSIPDLSTAHRESDDQRGPNREETSQAERNRSYHQPTVEDAEEDSTSDILLPSHVSSSVPSSNSLGSTSWQSRHDSPSSTDSNSNSRHQNLPIPAIVGRKNAYISILNSLGEPRMEAKYFFLLLLSLEGLLYLRQHFEVTKDPERAEIIQRLEHRVEQIKIFQGMYQLESQNQYFAHHPEYRQPLMQALMVKNSSFENELQKLRFVGKDAANLFSDPPPVRDVVHQMDDTTQTERQRGTESALSLVSARLNDFALAHDEEDENINDAPPFLTWAWLSSAFDSSVPVHRLAAENLYTIMEDINRNMSQRNEISYLRVQEVALEDLETLIENSNMPDAIESSLVSRGSTFVPRMRETQSQNGHLKDDVILNAQKRVISVAVREFFKTTKDFVDLFIPLASNHGVMKKIWGALHTISTDTIPDANVIYENAWASFFIRPLESSALQNNGLGEPSYPFTHCSNCRVGSAYGSIESAIRHLRQAHFPYSSHAELSTTWYRWVRSQEQLRRELQNKRLLRLLRICLNYLGILHQRAKKIHIGVSQDDSDDSAKYQLPNDLVDCFEATAVFIMQAAASVKMIKDELGAWQFIPGFSIEQYETPIVATALSRLGELGKAAQASMTRAEKTLALSDPETDILSLGPAGPEYLVAIICQNLQKKQLIEGVDMDVNELYQSYSSKLQYQINHFPRKRLLRDIHGLQEELAVVKAVNDWQQKTYTNFLQVLDPTSFDKATSNRTAMFPSESECLKASLAILESKATELDALDNRTRQLRDQLKQSVEILEEDHGKAILVFTMITTIFLPLSFVTSFFGMNTSDMRDTSHSSVFFWVIAIPVTFGIVAMSILIAYQGDKLSDAVIKTFHHLRQETSAVESSSAYSALPTMSNSRATYGQTARLWKHMQMTLRRSNVDSVLRA